MKAKRQERKDGLPNLKEPGAGLPFFQGLVVRYFLGGIASCHSDWGLDQKVFQKTHQRITQLIQNVSEENMTKCVLVKSIIGLEDSSRHWSIAMALEHIVFVGKSLADIIVTLSREEKMDVVIDISKVKPRGDKSVADVLESFQIYTDTILQQIENHTANRDSTVTLEHPWLGEMTVRQWHWLLARHSAIHLKQIEQIAATFK